MIRDDKQRVIGKLVNINSEKFTVELLNQSINFTVNGFDDIYQYAQINGYVILPYQDFYIVAEIFGVRERDSDTNWRGVKEQVLSKSNSVKYLDITPIGTIQGNKFKYGVSVFPTLYSDVLYVKKEELDIVFEVLNETVEITVGEVEGTKMNLLDIGTSTIFPDYKVKIDINSFFGAHSAILGNTGSGKSCTIASMMQSLLVKEGFSAVGASFIFFDVNGEYHKAFSQIKNPDIEIKYYSLDTQKDKDNFNYGEDCGICDNISYEKFTLPHWFLNIDEWALLLQASEKTQMPMLRSALGFSQNMNDVSKNHIYASNIMYVFENWDSPVAKRQRILSLIGKSNFSDVNVAGYSARYGNFESPAQENAFKSAISANIKIDEFVFPKYSNNMFEFSALEEHIEDAILYEEYHGNKQIRDYCSSLVTRYKSLKEREEFLFLTANNEDIDKSKFIDDLLGINPNKTKKTQISIIDLNSVEDEIVEVISCVISRMIFEKLKKIEPRNTFPINIVLEEAHRYISNDPKSVFGSANKIFERIAKEGRKYGLFLLASSQRPSELSRTVLSQCSNFIIHRIQNPEDLSQIRQMTPHISAGILSRLPSIPRQHALVFGHAVQIPTLFKVNNAYPTPHSNDNDVTKNWFIPKTVEEDFNDI
ncbi:ATP-binding protein [Mucilaginibacter sp. HMF5004]|uniref:ATP-binding protein n=1 Tax=Mucilaginibacter rivuli TaxID=2857527 RepID=UPI001C5E886C|nr:ATP-binding protein [Mucilaginibacter rivuli]MBW4888478.1 ATP-binding protein [Mucilaginibacter rivuli]